MQIYRAYLQDPSGAVTWAAWIHAQSPAQAQTLAGPMCAGAAPAVDLWWASARDLPPASLREAV